MRQLESFFWGIIAALGALVVEFVIFTVASFQPNATMKYSVAQFYAIPLFLAISVLIEETFKYLIMAKRIDSLSLMRTFIVNGLFVGAGFFLVELFLITRSLPSLPRPAQLFEIATIHMGTTGMMGYIIAVRNPNKFTTALFAVCLATAIHFSYNIMAQHRNFLTDYAILALIVVLITATLLNLARINRKLAS